jgi:polar amino acid transport system substrate-binding protein
VNLLEMIKTGEIDVVPGATAVAGRENYAWFSIPYRQEQFEVFVREGATLPSRNLLELAASGMKIGLTDGYFYGQLVDLAKQQHPDAFVYSSIAESTMLKLIEGNVSLIVEDPFVVNMILHQKDWHDEIARTEIDVANTPVSFMFSKKTTSGRQLLDFNMRLADFLATQRDEEILSSYLSDL